MIGYLKGTTVLTRTVASRTFLTVEVGGIGYELQVTPHVLKQLQVGETGQVFTHLSVREDQMVLFGFASAAERDLFRQLVSVNGIGAQLGLALLATHGITDLVQAVVTGNIHVLARTPGVGKKTAERIALELKAKLSAWRQESGLTSVPSGPSSEIQEDVEMTLLALGYTNTEISEALSALTQDDSLRSEEDSDQWIRKAIAYLS